MNKLDLDYQNLLKDILENGIKKETRNGGTISVFGRQVRHKMSEGFPLITTKKMFFKGIVTELLWFLRGDTNIKYLVDNGCNIWNGDAYKRYWDAHPDTEKSFQYEGSNIETRRMTKDEFIEMIKTDDEFAKKWGELGPIYGKQWRSWKRYRKIEDVEHKETLHIVDYIDQIQNLINDLKTNPDSRRLMVSAWNVGELDQMVLPPCHFSWQCYSHEVDGKRYLSLAWNQRSVDVGLGLPFNIASYALLLEIIAGEVDMVPYELIGNLGDCHIYNNHIEGLKEQLTRTPFELPKLNINNFRSDTNSVIFDTTKWSHEDFKIENYQYHPTIKLPLSN